MLSTAIFKRKNPERLKTKTDFLREEAERFQQLYSQMPLKYNSIPDLLESPKAISKELTV